MIKCPCCGSEEFETVDTCGGVGDEITEICICLDCDKQFCAVYELSRIEVDD